MANLLNSKLATRTAVLYSNLYWLSVKLHKLSSSNGVIKKCSNLNNIPKLSTLQGKCSSTNERHDAKRNLLVSRLAKCINVFKQLLPKHRKIANEFKSSIRLSLFNMLCSNILRTIKTTRVSSFKTKSKNLIARNNTTKNKINAYDVPVTNLSANELSD